jgi:toxin ParE1/3/4
MGLLRRTRRSDADLRRIYQYIALDSISAADRLLLRIKKDLMLSDMPGAGPARPELGKNVRSLPVGSYSLLYRPVRGGIHLLRVIHGARKLRRVFRRGED